MGGNGDESARESAGATTHVGNHTFRATDVTAYLKDCGTLKRAE
jgi:hypothetical protein